MPELPEVETVVRDLRREGILGKKIVGTRIYWPGVLAEPEPDAFISQVVGCRISDIWRRGKYIVIFLSSGGFLVVHLRMTGRLWVDRNERPCDKHEHVCLKLEDGRNLRFRDPRKFGRWWLVQDITKILGALGPEPVEAGFTFRKFRLLLSAKSGAIKPVLINQNIVAGLGNIYANEVLWEARVHPQRSCASLSPSELKRLHVAIRRILQRAIQAGGTSLGKGSSHFHRPNGARGTYQERLRVHGRTGEPCLRCGAQIERLVVAQRSSYVCLRCQPYRPSRSK